MGPLCMCSVHHWLKCLQCLVKMSLWWFSTMIVKTSLISTKTIISSAHFNERGKSSGKQENLDAPMGTVSCVICSGSMTTLNPQPPSQLYYIKLCLSSITTVQIRNVGAFWLTHYQPSQQKTTSKFILMHKIYIFLEEQERAIVSFSGQSRSRLLA